MFEVIVLSWFLTVGVVPKSTERIETNRIVAPATATVAEIGLGFDWNNHLKLGTSIRNYQCPLGDGYFSPYRVDYLIHVEYRISNWLRLTASHECDHAVSSSPQEKLTFPYGKSLTTVSVTFSGSTR